MPLVLALLLWYLGFPFDSPGTILLPYVVLLAQNKWRAGRQLAIKTDSLFYNIWGLIYVGSAEQKFLTFLFPSLGWITGRWQLITIFCICPMGYCPGHYYYIHGWAEQSSMHLGYQYMQVLRHASKLDWLSTNENLKPKITLVKLL